MKRTILFLTVLIVGLAGNVRGAALAQDPAIPVAAGKPAAAVPTKEMVWLDDELPPNAKTDGIWIWDTTTFSSGAKSHGHPSTKGLASHGFTADPVSLSNSGMIVQQVWLDPKDPPKGILLKFKLTSGDEVGVYWEGEEEVFNPGENEEVWYYGLLPELGKWTSLEILAEDLGLENEKITGITFITFDGRALWDKTVLTEAPPAEELENLPELPSLKPESEEPPKQTQ